MPETKYLVRSIQTVFFMKYFKYF